MSPRTLPAVGLKRSVKNPSRLLDILCLYWNSPGQFCRRWLSIKPALHQHLLSTSLIRIWRLQTSKSDVYRQSPHWNIFVKTMETKGDFAILNHHECLILVISSFRFILISMLWVYGHYKYFNNFSVGTVVKRQNLTSTDVRFWCLKAIPALQGLTWIWGIPGFLGFP